MARVNNPGLLQRDLPSVIVNAPAYPANGVAAFNAAAASVVEGGTLDIKPGKYFLSGIWSIPRNININANGAEIVLDSGGGAYIDFPSTQYLNGTAPGTSLTSMPVRGTAQLAWSSAPSLDPSDHFVYFDSTEDLIQRIGPEAYPFYKKQELGAFIRDDWTLRTPLNISYATAAALTLRFFRKGSPVVVKGLRLSVEPAGGVTTKAQCIVLNGRSNIQFDGLLINRRATNWAGTNLVYINCYGLTFDNCWVLGSNSDIGDSYAFQHSVCDTIVFNGGGYVDSGGAVKRERGIAGRHGSNFRITGTQVAGIDDHWGYRYLIQGVHAAVRGIGISGGDVTLLDCSNPSGPLYQLRSDAPYADGDLLIERCHALGQLVRSYRAVDARPTRRKSFDRIVARDSTVVAVPGQSVMEFDGFPSSDARSPTQSILIDNVRLLGSINSNTSHLIKGNAQYITAHEVTMRGGQIRPYGDPNPVARNLTSSVSADRIAAENVHGNPGEFAAVGQTSDFTGGGGFLNLRSGKSLGFRAMNTISGQQVFASGSHPEDSWLDVAGAVVHQPLYPQLLDSDFSSGWTFTASGGNTITPTSPGVQVTVETASPNTSLVWFGLAIGRHYRIEIDVETATAGAFYLSGLSGVRYGQSQTVVAPTSGTIIYRGYAVAEGLGIIRNGAPVSFKLTAVRIFGGV